MASYTQIIYHIVFSTKNRAPYVQGKDIRIKTHAYLAGICKNLQSPALIVGGIEAQHEGASMAGAALLLVLGANYVVTFVGWEGVGLCSYLLIGFWFSEKANADAGKKAFVVNRIGDFGFMVAMFLLFAHLGTLMPDGSPQVTPLWWDFDGTHVLLNSARGRAKDKNMRRDGRVALGGDGQVTLGDIVIKATARKVRKLYKERVLAGFAGSTADAFTLFERFESKLEKHQGHLTRSAVELAKDWRTDRYLRRLEALMAVADGASLIHGAHHVHRGYENIEGKFLELGARIERVAEGATAKYWAYAIDNVDGPIAVTCAPRKYSGTCGPGTLETTRLCTGRVSVSLLLAYTRIATPNSAPVTTSGHGISPPTIPCASAAINPACGAGSCAPPKPVPPALMLPTCST